MFKSRMKDQISKIATFTAITAPVGFFYCYQDKKRFSNWTKENPNKKCTGFFQNVAGTMGYWQPGEPEKTKRQMRD